VYVTASMRGRGLGTELITALAAEGRTRAFSYLYAVVYARNRASVAAFEQSGFVPQIVLPDANNRPDTGWEDVVVLMRSLRES
ncbi:MAG TPA: GNAT family N-acetyltransferase, partial [Trebonia sp.]